MLNKKVAKLMVNQVNKELYSSYLYLAISNYYAEEGLNGFASWFKKQAAEESEHADKFMEYLHDNDEKVVLETIEAYKGKFKDYKEPLTLQLSHEKYVTSLINDIYTAAIEAKDYRSLNFLNWFITEQAEEEKTAQDLLKEFELFAIDSKGVFEFSEKLAKIR